MNDGQGTNHSDPPSDTQSEATFTGSELALARDSTLLVRHGETSILSYFFKSFSETKCNISISFFRLPFPVFV